MRIVRLIIAVSIFTAISAAIGALAGSIGGRRITFLAATVMGTLGLLLIIKVVAKLGWFDPNRTRGAAIGGLVGFGLGVPLALISPVHPAMIVLGTLLIGIGMVAGAGPASAR